MKSCPLCGRTFPDEYSFCLTDGTHLGSAAEHTEDPTLVRERPVPGERPVVSGRAVQIEQPIERKRSRRGIILFALAALLSLFLGITAAAVYYFWPRENKQPQIATTSPSPAASPAASPSSPTPRPTTTPKPSASPTSTPDNKPDDTPPRNTPDPGTTRISFRAGRAQETISGNLNDQRSFVLSARPGQTMSADVSSSDECVNFTSGDPSVRLRTQAGDNALTIVNSCDHPARFTLTVSIR